jgi:hypothetical protein
MGLAKTREWTEEETKLLIELAQRKERVPAMARELGRHIASVIPDLIDQNPCAHRRNPMDMIFQGRSMSVFQA